MYTMHTFVLARNIYQIYLFDYDILECQHVFNGNGKILKHIYTHTHTHMHAHSNTCTHTHIHTSSFSV